MLDLEFVDNLGQLLDAWGRLAQASGNIFSA